MKNKLYMLLLAVLLLVGCASNAQVQTQEQTNGEQQVDNEQQETTQTAPDDRNGEEYVLAFEAATIDGERFTSDKFADSEVTMINVWATYCNPCLSEMPALGELASEYDSKEVQIIGIISDVTEDSSETDIENAKQLIDETKADYPHLLLNQSLYDNFVGGISSVPTTFFVDSEGKMLGYAVGANDKSVWQGMIAKALSAADGQEGDEAYDK